MINRFIYTLLLSVVIVLFPCLVHAQMVGDNVFLKGRYVEVGIAPNGGYGSTLPTPAGYHPYLGTGVTFTFWDPAAASATTSSNFLGFVADYGRDGWTVGTPPFFGDFYLPGHPQEGWAIRVGGSVGTEGHAYIPAYQYAGGPALTGYTGALAGTNTSYINSGGISQGVWQGTYGTLAIRQTTTLDTTKLYFTVNVVITNTGSTPVDSIYYTRTVDPDNDETRVIGEYTTVNSITYQLPDPGNKVLVSTTGVTDTNAYLGLGTKDCRARCMIFSAGLDPGFTLDSMWRQLTPYIYPQGTGSTNDVGIALDFNLGDLAPGDSTTLSYAYVLNATYIDSALNSLQPGGLNVNGSHYDSTATINLCTYVNDSIAVSMPGGGFYHWTWSPDSMIGGSGTSFEIHSDSINTDVVYTVTGTNAAGGCDSIVYLITLNHATFSPTSPPGVTYCQDGSAAALIPPPAGVGVLWYTSLTGGVASSTPPIPSTLVPGMFIYYFTETIGLCHSVRTPDTVNIIALPSAPYLFDPSPYCQAQPFEPFTVTGTGVLWYTAPTGGFGSTVAPTVNTGIPGTYSYYASQTVNGCEGPRQSISVTVLDSIIPVYNYVIHYGCHGDTVVFHNSSRGASVYRWDFGDGYTDTATSPSHIYLTQGTFIAKLTTITSSCVDSLIDTIPLIHPLQALFTASPDILCQKDSVVFTNSSTGAIAYEWLFGNGAVSALVNPSYTYYNSGVYTVKLVASNFIPCYDTAAMLVYVDSISPVSISVTDSVLCRSTYVTFTGNYTSIGNTGVTWYFGDGDSVLNINPVSHAYDGSGIETVRAVAHYRACRDTSAERAVTVFAMPSVDLGSDTTICPGSVPLVLKDNQNAGIKGATWKWSSGQTTPSITVTTPGQYYVIVGINGCYTSDSILVQNDCYMDIPNVFTPNNDGFNDYFFPRLTLTKGLATFKIDIYNRWGQLIFESTSLDGAGWDGKLNGVGQPEGVYVYQIDATFVDGQKEHRQGNVTLMR